MKNLLDKHLIIKLKLEDHSNRAVAKMVGIDRKTVARYWNEYKKQQEELCNPFADVATVQEQIVSAPKYNSSNRKSRKYTEDIDVALDELLLEERKKDVILGSHKQSLTRQQIHKSLVEQGFDISYTTIASSFIKPKLELAKISLNNVNKYSFVKVDNNFYSVPEYLVGLQVSIKTYFDRIAIYSNNSKVCGHKKIDGFNEISIEITHYLNSFIRQPGALKNLVPLKSLP